MVVPEVVEGLWDLVGDHIYYISRPAADPLLMRFDARNRKLVKLGTLPRSTVSGMIFRVLTVAPNESEFIFLQETGSGTDIMLVEDFK